MTDPQQLPATASAPRILHAANDLELVGELDAASKAYQALLTRWPDTAPAYFGAGNACYGLGQYPQARDYFSGYIARQPGAAAGWNNLAYTLIKLHCFNEANAAIDCARKLEPDNRLLTNSHAEISAYKQPTPTLNTQCAIPACPTE
jgi:tetratricopeptide (TPR) repeat protein